MAFSVDWSVSINGEDRSIKIAPYLIEIEVHDLAGTVADTCNLTLDDTDGLLDVTSEGRQLTVGLNGLQVFDGTIDSVRSNGTRGGGRRLAISAAGFDTRGKAKQMQGFHKDDASLQEFLEEAGKRAGYSLVIDPELAAIRRDYWSADYESFLDLGSRLARELNATFKLRGDKAVLAARGASALPPITGVFGNGGNVISWDIQPFRGRPAFTRAEARWFDRKSAQFKSETVDIDLGRELPAVPNIARGMSADQAQAAGVASGRKGQAEREAGGGRVEIDIEPQAQAEAPFVLTGAKPGIDGEYRITGVTHRANRTGGAVTSLEIEQPQIGGQ